MELLQLIFSVIAGLGAGAMGALIFARRDEDADHEPTLTERLQELEHQAAADRHRMERLYETAGSGERDLRSRMQAALVARDERLEALHARLLRMERAVGESASSLPKQRLQARLQDAAGRIESIEAAVARLEQRVQSKLIAFREGTQEVLRKLAEHQVDEAERVTKLERTTAILNERLRMLFDDDDDARPTTAALVEVLQTQVVLTERATALETQVEASLEHLQGQLAEVETRVLAIDELQAQLTRLQAATPDDDRIGAIQTALNVLQAQLSETRAARLPPGPVASPRAPAISPFDLRQVFGIGPKLAERLIANGVADVRTLAELTGEDVERLGQAIRGFKDRQQRHDWIGQAKRLVAEEAPANDARSAAPASDGAAAPAEAAAKAEDAAPRRPHASVSTAASADAGVATSADDGAARSDRAPEAQVSDGDSSAPSEAPVAQAASHSGDASRAMHAALAAWPVPTTSKSESIH